VNNKNLTRIAIAILLTTPIMGIVITNYLHAIHNAYVPTGFFQYDMPYYLANAHQYVDGQHNGIAYSNPYDFEDNSPRIYFHLLHLIYGILLNFLDPGFIYVASGLLFAAMSFYFLQKLIDEYSPNQGMINVLMTFIVAWGGGCLVLISILVSVFKGNSIHYFTYDPFDGWWFLNFGRNFIYSTEGFYHLLVVLLFLSVIQKKFTSTLVITWGLVLSHPFTGLQYSLIVACWFAFERYFLGTETVRRQSAPLFFLPVLFCIVYSLVFLPLFPSHKALMTQMTLDWSMKSTTILGAYILVAVPVFIRIRNSKKFVECFQDPFNRFLAVSALVSFLLANHEFFIANPMQPLHFTRGHIWTPLCLLAIPVFISIIKRISNFRNIFARVFCSSILIIALTSDNFVWFIDKYSYPLDDINISSEDFEIINYFKTRSDQPIVIFENLKAGYLTATYTSARPYFGHWGGNTPYTQRKIISIMKLFIEGIEPEELKNRYYIVVTKSFKSQIENLGYFREIHSAHGISVYERILI